MYRKQEFICDQTGLISNLALFWSDWSRHSFRIEMLYCAALNTRGFVLISQSVPAKRESKRNVLHCEKFLILCSGGNI